MNSIIFVCLSVIVVAPILYFLPLGFTTKGKMFILGTSFVLALLGILSGSVFAVWQTVLILFLLIVLTTLLGYKRVGAMIFMNNDENSPIESEWENRIEPQQDQLSEDIPIQMEPLEVNEEELSLLLSESINDSHHLKDDLTEMEEMIVPEDDLEDSFIAEINPISIEKSNDDNDLIEPKNDLQIQEGHYLAELEQLILDDSIILQEDHLDSIESHDVEELDLPVNSKQYEADNLELDEDQLIEDKIGFEEMLESEVVLELEEKQNISVVDYPSSPVYEEVAVSSEIDNNNQLTNNIENEALHKLLFNTMVTQIQITRKLIDSKKYEQMIREYLHPELPTNEYYTFAILLIQHYISEKQYDKLLPFLNEIEEKVTTYPMLLQEIQFFKSFCVKI
ncbi:hypothetical protein J1P26_13460 [Neobacillus sp. MM2021_6]|uniref:hypothetical protein n=1 Tax=Bacillaceae TaxID=186817 RepID=UPI00140C674C|nr:MULTISPECIES: hypothetical protein [Bacillaceae]MBO0960706.1 hypothetical protein [Neobacillus sp. MM2021_6]NHC17372.1 hypothetical protein [Bacillus sp. MM2020_4]